jgi:hypothetical protein
MTTHEDHDGDTTEAPASGIPQTKTRTRKSRGRHLPPDRLPEVVEKMIDDRPAVEVELFGSIADRISPESALFMVLDAEDWQRIQVRQKWWAMSAWGRKYYIASGKTKLSGLVDQADESRPCVILSRLIMKAKGTQIVCTPPGNPLDLRKANLWLVDGRGEWAEVRAIQKQFQEHLESTGF